MIARFADSVSQWAWSKHRLNSKPNYISSNEVSSFTQDVWTSNHHLIVDEPKYLGGDDKGATPFELLQAALASCTTITLRMYCKKKKIDVEHISVKVSKEKTVLLKDENPKIATTLYTISIKVTGDVSTADKKRLTKIAARCPVHLALKNTPQFYIQIN